MDDVIPSTPDPTVVALLGSIIRTVLGMASAFGMTWAATVSGDQMTMIASGLAMLGTLVWSLWQKKAAAKKLHAAAQASAVAGAAVRPAV